MVPQNGSAQYSSVEFGSRVRYTCDDGFKIEGESFASCLQDGSWSNPSATCKRKWTDDEASLVKILFLIK